MIKRILPYLPLCVLTLCTILLVAFAEKELSDVKCTDVSITIKKNLLQNMLLNSSDVYESIKESRNSLIGKEIYDINIDEIEAMLEENPYVLNCETYFSMNGEMHINIEQRTPIIRIITDNSMFYIDKLGKKMPLSPRGSGRVLVASGEISDTSTKILRELYHFAEVIDKDIILKPLIEQIYVTEENEFIISCKLGPDKILFGTSDDFETKIKKLKAFYNADIAREKWNEYNLISLKYRNQIICKKK